MNEKTSLEFNIILNGIKFKIFINDNFALSENSIKSVPHDHYDYELHYLKKGSYSEVISDEITTLKEGEIIIIKPYQIHYRSRLENANFYDYNFRFLPIKPSDNAKNSEKKSYIQLLNVFDNFKPSALSDNLVKFFEGIELELSKREFGFVDAVKSYVELILLELLRRE